MNASAAVMSACSDKLTSLARLLMFVRCHFRKSTPALARSALPPRTDIISPSAQVRKVHNSGSPVASRRTAYWPRCLKFEVMTAWVFVAVSLSG